MAGKAIPTVEHITLGDMLAQFTREQLFSMPTVDTNKAGVVLCNERVKAFVPDDDGVPREFTVSLYIQRAPMSEDETAAVAKVADERKANADSKKAEEQAKRERETRAAFDLGQQATIGALKQLDTLQSAAAVLARQIKG